MFKLLTHLSIELCMSFSFVLKNKLPKKLSAILRSKRKADHS